MQISIRFLSLDLVQEKHLRPKDPVCELTQADLLCGNYFLHGQLG